MNSSGREVCVHSKGIEVYSDGSNARAERFALNIRAFKRHPLVLRRTSSLPSMFLPLPSGSWEEHRLKSLEPFYLDLQLQHHHHQQSPAIQCADNHVDGAALDSGAGDMPEPEEAPMKLSPLAEKFVPVFALNPDAEEFLLPTQTNTGSPALSALSASSSSSPSSLASLSSQGGMQSRNRIDREHLKADRIRRTVYVSNIGCEVNEMQLSAVFMGCGQIVDCRICSVISDVEFRHFAFVEFTYLAGAYAALSLSGVNLGYHSITVSRSKTGIVPVNHNFLPLSEHERRRCERTVYCTNIDKDERANVEPFFQYHCGEISQLRLVKSRRHRQTLVVFVEFVWPESAIAALNCSGIPLGSRQIKVSPSKTPVWLDREFTDTRC